MATTSKIARNQQRRALVNVYREKRKELKTIAADVKRPAEEREDALRQLRALPRDSSPTRLRNRCAVTGRPRGYYRRFGLSRIALRELALRGDLPGVIKASW